MDIRGPRHTTDHLGHLWGTSGPARCSQIAPWPSLASCSALGTVLEISRGAPMRQQARRSDKDSSRHQTRAASPGRVPQICQGQYRDPAPSICCACQSGMETGCSNAPALLFIREIHPVSLQAPLLSRNLSPFLARGNMPSLLGRSLDVRYADCSQRPACSPDFGICQSFSAMTREWAVVCLVRAFPVPAPYQYRPVVRRSKAVLRAEGTLPTTCTQPSALKSCATSPTTKHMPGSAIGI